MTCEILYVTGPAKNKWYTVYWLFDDGSKKMTKMMFCNGDYKVVSGDRNIPLSVKGKAKKRIRAGELGRPKKNSLSTKGSIIRGACQNEGFHRHRGGCD